MQVFGNIIFGNIIFGNVIFALLLECHLLDDIQVIMQIQYLYISLLLDDI